MIGDVLKERIHELSEACDGRSKAGGKKLWQILKDIAIEDIKSVYPDRVSSRDIIPIYYQILSENKEVLSDYYKEILPSNKQERFRVIIRNIFGSNSSHKDGIATSNLLKVVFEVNSDRRGKKVVYQYKGE